MVLPESASEAADFLSRNLYGFREGAFLRENQKYEYLASGIEAIVEFLLNRPAMMVSDAQNRGGILAFVDKEWYEAQHAESNETSFDLFMELGDTVFFALLSGILHWDEIDTQQREFIKRAIDASVETANAHELDIVEAVKYVSQVKDPINYRREFYQLIDGEETRQVFDRVVPIGKLHRKIRDKLNGEWSGADDLLDALRLHYSTNDENKDLSAFQIRVLFDLAGLDLCLSDPVEVSGSN